MPDYDVKVGVTTVGDTSGADKVNGAIGQVGQTAERVSQETAAASKKATDQLSDAAQQVKDSWEAVNQNAANFNFPEGSKNTVSWMENLQKALNGLDPSRAKVFASTFTQAISGLATGNIQDAIGGTANLLLKLSGAMPLPGVGIAIGAVLTAATMAYKKFSKDTEATFNEFGETLEKEQDRLDAVAKKKIEWEGLKGAATAIETEFGKVESLTNTVGDALRKVFNSTYNFQIASLKDQLQAAGLGEDTKEQIQAQINRISKEQELVNNTLALDRLKKQLENNIEAAQLEQKFIERKIAEADATLAEMKQLKENAKKAGLSDDILYKGGISEGLRGDAINQLNSRIEALTNQLAHMPSSGVLGDVAGAGLAFPTSGKDRATIQTELAGLEKLRQQLLNFDALAEREAEAIQYRSEGLKNDQDTVSKKLADSVAASAAALEAQNNLSRSMDGADKDIIDKSQKTAAAISKYEEQASAAIEAGVKVGDAAADVVDRIIAGGDFVSKGFTDAVDTVTTNIDALKQQIAQKQQEISAIQAEIDAAPAGTDTSAKVKKIQELFAEIQDLDKQVSAAMDWYSQQAGKNAAAATAAGDKQKKAFSDLEVTIQQGATKVVNPITVLGGLVSGAAAVAAGLIEGATKTLTEKTKAIGDGASKAGEEVTRKSDEFFSKLLDAAGKWNGGADKLIQAANDYGNMGVQLARMVYGMANEVATLRQQSESALAAARLALQQNRNMA